MHSPTPLAELFDSLNSDRPEWLAQLVRAIPRRAARPLNGETGNAGLANAHRGEEFCNDSRVTVPCKAHATCCFSTPRRETSGIANHFGKFQNPRNSARTRNAEYREMPSRAADGPCKTHEFCMLKTHSRGFPRIASKCKNFRACGASLGRRFGEGEVNR